MIFRISKGFEEHDFIQHNARIIIIFYNTLAVISISVESVIVNIHIYIHSYKNSGSNEIKYM